MTTFLDENLMKDSELSKLQGMVERQLVLESEIEEREEELKIVKKQYNEVRQNQIPDFLSQFGISEIRLADGKKVTVKPDVSVTIKNKEAFFKFLKDRRDDSIIKSVMEIEDPSRKFVEELIERSLHFNYEHKVHGQTLKAYFREFLKQGETPPDSVSVFTYSITKIK